MATTILNLHKLKYFKNCTLCKWNYAIFVLYDRLISSIIITPSSSMLACMTGFTFLKTNNNPLYVYIPFSLYIHPSMVISVVSLSWQVNTINMEVKTLL
jgi:hypothetical protein